jgi:uncharacterized protein with ATP-grasp and redox domains
VVAERREAKRKPLDPLECVLCLVHGRLQQLGGRLDLEARMLGYIAGLVARWSSRTDVFVDSYEYLTRLLGGRDPYGERRRLLNERALRLLPRLGLDEMDAPGLVSLMAAANGVDIDMPGYLVDDSRVFRGLSEQPQWSGTGPEELEQLLARTREIVLVLDNAGEAVFDIAAASRLARLTGARLYLVARSRPYEVDVTASMVAELKHRLAPEAVLVETGGRYPVFHPRSAPEARRLLRGRGRLVLSKGIANLEAYMDNPGSVGEGAEALFLLRAKCGPLARFFGVALADPVVVTGDWVVSRLHSLQGGGERAD